MLREYYIYTVILKYVLGKHNMTVVLQACGFSSLSLQYRVQNSPLAIFFFHKFSSFLWLLEYRLFIAGDTVSSQRTIFTMSVLQLSLSLY